MEQLQEEVFDALAQAPRKSLLQLLTVFVRLSSADVLTQLRLEALRLMAPHVACPSSPTPFQRVRCTPRVLHACFAFLDTDELRVAEVVCRRWRAACVDHGAGWTEALGREPATLRWLHELHRHHLPPARLARMSHAQLASETPPSLLAAVARLPHLASLALGPREVQNASALALLPPLQSIALGAVSTQLLALPCVASATAIRITARAPGVTELRALAKFPHLRALSLGVSAMFNIPEQFALLPDLSSLHTLALSCPTGTAGQLRILEQLPLLHTLTLRHVALDASLRACLHALTGLTSLGLPHAFWRSVPESLSFAALPSLTHLDLSRPRMPSTVYDWQLGFSPPMRALRTLDLCALPLRDCHIRGLVELRNLEQLNCSFPEHSAGQLTGCGFAALRTTALRLHTLDVRGQPLTLEGVGDIAHLPALTSVLLTQQSDVLRKLCPSLVISSLVLGGTREYDATVMCVNEDGTYVLRYGDGDVDRECPESSILRIRNYAT